MLISPLLLISSAKCSDVEGVTATVSHMCMLCELPSHPDGSYLKKCVGAILSLDVQWK